MTINHLNLVVTDVSRAADFFTGYFGFHCELIKGDAVIAILRNKEDFILVLMADKNGQPVYPANFHFGFILDDTESVDRVYDQLVQGKMDIGRPPGKIRDGYGFYFYFENIMIEVGAGMQRR